MASKLRGVTPDKIQKRLKMLVFGPPSSRKTTNALGFKKTYFFDLERGAENDQYVELLKSNGGIYFPPTIEDEFGNRYRLPATPENIETELKTLLSEKHPYWTTVIDPITATYNELLDEAAEKVGTDFGRHKGPANRAIKRIYNLLTRLDTNVIVTSHAKTKWERGKDGKGNDTIIDAGVTFDAFDKSDYLFDLVLEIQLQGPNCMAIVRKSRIEGFPLLAQFPFCYDEIASRYGREHLERDSTPVELASQEQLAEIDELLKNRTDADTLKEKWLKAAEANELSEMTSQQITKCIDMLKGKK